MRDDRDAARAIIWWGVVPLVLLVASMVARGAELTACPAGTPWADPETCPAFVDIDALEVVGNTLLVACDFPYEGDVDCLAADVLMPWSLRQEVGAFWLNDIDGWALVGDIEALVGGGGDPGGGDPGGDDEWTVDDLDLAAFAGAFSAAFMICALFWGLGKSVGLLIHALKRW